MIFTGPKEWDFCLTLFLLTALGSQYCTEIREMLNFLYMGALVAYRHKPENPTFVLRGHYLSLSPQSLCTCETYAVLSGCVGHV